jgi:hypothetical protein
MPPWYAARPAGFAEFQGDERHLTDDEISTLKRWVDARCRAAILESPGASSFPAGWSLGTPDLVAPFPPDQCRQKGLISIATSCRRSMLRTITGSRRSISSPARKVLHHALFFTAPATAAVRDDEVVKPGLGLGGRRGGSGAQPVRPTRPGGARRLGAGHHTALLSGWHRAAAPETHQSSSSSCTCIRPAKRSEQGRSRISRSGPRSR